MLDQSGRTTSRLNMLSHFSRQVTFTILIFAQSIHLAFGQSHQSKYLSIGGKIWGLCLGNSYKYSGLRFNLWDRELYPSNQINGVNTAFNLEVAKSNGIQIGLFADVDRLNGISITPIWLSSSTVTGIGMSFGINADTLTGIFVGFGIAGPDPNPPNQKITGLAFGFIKVGAQRITGLVGSAMWTSSNQMYGVSIAPYNKAENLHGLQIGLLNYAGNNPKLLKWLPAVNFHQ